MYIVVVNTMSDHQNSARFGALIHIYTFLCTLNYKAIKKVAAFL